VVVGDDEGGEVMALAGGAAGMNGHWMHVEGLVLQGLH
jgi:hypothetical protein